jgi:hypothetical protein
LWWWGIASGLYNASDWRTIAFNGQQTRIWELRRKNNVEYGVRVLLFLFWGRGGGNVGLGIYGRAEINDGKGDGKGWLY